MKIELYGAEGKFQEVIEIKRNESRFGGFDYTVYNRRANREGYVKVRLRDLDWFERTSNLATESLIEIVEFEGVPIAEITEFKPHGEKPINPRLLKKGVGTCVLRSVLSDIEGNRINFDYCYNPLPKFYRLLTREGFEDLEIPNDKPHLLRVS